MARDEQFDPYEIGARNSDPLLAAMPIPLPLETRRLSPLKLLGGFAVLVLVVALLRNGGGTAPSLDGSCTTPAFTLSTDEISRSGVVRWSAVGPADASVVFGLAPKGTMPGPVPTSVADGKLTGPIALTGCDASGQFGVIRGAGEYVVTAYALSAGGSVTVLGSRPLVVDEG